MIDKSGLVLCPICHSKTKTKVNKDTILHHFPLFCPKCKQESVVDIDMGNIKLVEKNDNGFEEYLKNLIHEEVTFSIQKEIGRAFQDLMK